MQIAILSDIHDHLPNLHRALALVEDCDALLCCGDLCSPFVMRALAEGFPRPIHLVFGNNDGDRFRIARQAQPFPHATLHGEYAELVFDGKSIALQHFDDIGRALAAGGQFDLVCFGHNHQFEITQVGRTLLVNPGELLGYLSGESSFVRYDTVTATATRILLHGQSQPG